MKLRILTVTWAFLACAAAVPVHAEALDEKAHSVPLSYSEFMQRVASSNLQYAAQRYEVSIAEAAAAAARLWPNPELELVTERERVGAGEDPARPARGLGVVQTFELGGKRAARIEAARAAREVEAQSLKDFWRELEGEASIAFIEALRARELFNELNRAHELARDLIEATQLLFDTGDIPEVDLLQLRVEERQIRGDMLAARSESLAAAFELNRFLGSEYADVFYAPRGRLRFPDLTPNRREMVRRALENRPDLKAADYAVEEGRAESRLARAERIPDVEVGLGFIDEREAPTAAGRSPRVRTWELSVTVPIPVFDSGRQEWRMARYRETQLELARQDLEVQVRQEVRQAHAAYEGSRQRLSQFEEEILEASREVVAAKLLSYQQGETSLLEVLDAQRTANELQSEYVEALADSLTALVELSMAASDSIPRLVDEDD